MLKKLQTKHKRKSLSEIERFLVEPAAATHAHTKKLCPHTPRATTMSDMQRSMSTACLAPHNAVVVRVAFPEFGITKTVRVCPQNEPRSPPTQHR